jgi:transposase InsO family protein
MYGKMGVTYFCKLFGKSRQAYYKQDNQEEKYELQDALVLKLVSEIRQDLPRCGTDKLHYMLQSSFAEHGIKMGRDGLYELLGRHGLLIRFRKRRPFTTDSNHPYRKYPNLIRGKVLTQAGELWVSDITYIRQNNGFNYLSIVTDAYSHKIVGYNLSKTLHAQGAIDALVMAGKDVKRTNNLIHHSDRGVQYCCHDYVAMIEHLGIQLSMTEKGDPYENAIAERVNGILKAEFQLGQTFDSHEATKNAVDDAVKKYNELRIHDSCGRLTPMQAHEEKGFLEKYWKPKVYKQKVVEVQQGET